MSELSLPDELRTIFLFEECTEDQIQWVATNAEAVRIPAGTLLFSEAAVPDAFWVLLEGELEFSGRSEGHEIIFDRSTRPGVWGGWLPHFETTPVALRVRTTRDSRLLRIPKEAMRVVMANGFPTTHLLAGIMSGTRTFEGAMLQHEKLAALGRLSAGLAHELNNPAAAAKRAASDLRAAIHTRDERGVGLIRTLDGEQMRQNVEFVHEIGHRDPIRLDPLARSELEDKVIAWLEQYSVDDADYLGPALIEASVTLDDLESLRTRIPAETLPDVIFWLEAATSADELARVIETSVGRISEIVAAVKEYTFMDREGQQEVDLHQGLDSTLLMLRHQLKTGIEVTRDYDESLPKVPVYGSELNQVWTNLIENAIQAMNGRGHLQVRTRRDLECGLVEIEDDGPGIPAEIKTKIFEPFFTTKGVGVGSGLGLDIVRRIVWHHNGDIRVDSRPGRTCFHVRLPLSAQPN
jgi:signal transduction histidine kinase